MDRDLWGGVARGRPYLLEMWRARIIPPRGASGHRRGLAWRIAAPGGLGAAPPKRYDQRRSRHGAVSEGAPGARER